MCQGAYATQIGPSSLLNPRIEPDTRTRSLSRMPSTSGMVFLESCAVLQWAAGVRYAAAGCLYLRCMADSALAPGPTTARTTRVGQHSCYGWSRGVPLVRKARVIGTLPVTVTEPKYWPRVRQSRSQAAAWSPPPKPPVSGTGRQRQAAYAPPGQAVTGKASRLVTVHWHFRALASES